MRVLLDDPPKDVDQKIAKAAKLCYSACGVEELSKKVEKQDVSEFIKKILTIGHYSVLEHVSFSFIVEGISRVLSHQLVRHRIASYSQQSQRYVELDKTFDYIVPDSIENINVDTELFGRYELLMDEIHRLYNQYLEAGILAEDARYILPNATETKVYFTMNVRTLLHFFNVRCCNRAQWEIRKMATEMLKEVKKVAPILFQNSGPSCVTGACQEGSFSCGESIIVRERFKNL